MSSSTIATNSSPQVNAKHVLVIGGGVIGAMCALELSHAGCQVTIVEKDRWGAACSHGNCGYVSPSHVLPLAQPGTIRKTLKQMFQANSPFAIKPRLSWQALQWFLKFAGRCNQRDMLDAAGGNHAMLQSSKELYQRWVSQGLECQWQEVGNLFVFEHQRDFEAFADTERLIQQNFGVSATPLPMKQLVELEPAIKPVVAGAWYYQGDCHLRPDLLMSGLRTLLENRNVSILENCEVKRLIADAQAIRGVEIDGDTIEADQFVVAMGAWTPFLNRQLGCKIPIQPGKGYSLTMPAPEKMPKIPIIFEDTHVAITPLHDKYRIGSTMEFVGYNTTIHRKRLNLLKASAERYLVDPVCEPIEEEWFGWRPMTYDSLPIIDRSPAWSNVWICSGHSMLGISMATGSGKLLREMLLGETPHLETSHYSLKRFTKKTVFRKKN